MRAPDWYTVRVGFWFRGHRGLSLLLEDDDGYSSHDMLCWTEVLRSHLRSTVCVCHRVSCVACRVLACRIAGNSCRSSTCKISTFCMQGRPNQRPAASQRPLSIHSCMRLQCGVADDDYHYMLCTLCTVVCWMIQLCAWYSILVYCLTDKNVSMRVEQKQRCIDAQDVYQTSDKYI